MLHDEISNDNRDRLTHNNSLAVILCINGFSMGAKASYKGKLYASFWSYNTKDYYAVFK